ncbi:MAG TPA: DUF1828 domain-containing protein [Tissierellaceae bacterium]
MLKEQINKFPEMFYFEKEEQLYVIKTPFEYPDGDEIDLYLFTKNSKIIISDLGETMQYLASYNIEVKNSPKKMQVIEDAIRGTCIEFFRGQFFVTLDELSEIAFAVIDLAQVIIRVSDLIYTIRGRTFASFEEDVKEFLEVNRYPYEEQYLVTGSSGLDYRIDFAVKKDSQTKLIQLISPPNPSNISAQLNKVIRVWVDILPVVENKKMLLSLFDDTAISYRPEFIKLAERVSIPLIWSNKESIKKHLDDVA